MANGPKAPTKAVPPPSIPPSQPISPNSSTTPQPTVNRKKAKRRQKAALKAAAAEALDPSNSSDMPPPTHEDLDDLDDDSDEEEDYDDEKPNGTSDGKKKSRKKKKNKSINSASATDQLSLPHNHGSNQQSIWNTSSQEEQNQIKDFWHGLTESERKSLVKIEKDAVLKTLKEQQKQSCSCTVCGRKRTAIEEELETLYDAYYNELETYDHDQPLDSHQPSYRSPNGASLAQLPPMNRDYPDEVYEEDGEFDEDSETYPYEDETDNFITSQLFDFGNSLTVKGSYYPN